MALKFNPFTGNLDQTGISQSTADTRYVNITGDTMTGALNITAPNTTSLELLKINNNTGSYGWTYSNAGSPTTNRIIIKGVDGSGITQYQFDPSSSNYIYPPLVVGNNVADPLGSMLTVQQNGNNIIQNWYTAGGQLTASLYTAGAADASKRSILDIYNVTTISNRIHGNGVSYFNGGQVIIGATSGTGLLSVNGNSDTVQALIKGNATQTSNLLELRNSSDSVQLSVTANGSTGIGTNAPNNRLDVRGTQAGVASQIARFANTSGTAGSITQIGLASDEGGGLSTKANIQAGLDAAANSGYIAFLTRNAGSITEKVRINYQGHMKTLGRRQPVTTKAINYTLLVTDEVVVFTATATATLPAATGTGQTYRIICRAGTTTIDANGSETIKGELTQTLSAGEDIIITDTANGIYE